MTNYNNIKDLTIEELENKYPFVISFFENNNLDVQDYYNYELDSYINHFTEEEIEQWTIDKEKLKVEIVEYINQMANFLGMEEELNVNSLTIIAGTNKDGQRENFDSVIIRKSDIISIVGPTGSGKSRLLADIEWTANKDTPTNRRILINDELPDNKWRFSSSNKLVAQLSQNMNFVMDLTVEEFISLHAKSRLIVDEEEVISKIIEAANYLAGEKFNLDTPITSLSGGQSRALMIADTAILSMSPIVLIDEIENAGIDRKKALNLLVNEEKIVLIATHDPTLALMADKRIVIENGGISNIIVTSKEEKEILNELEQMDKIINNLRLKLRKGQKINKLSN